MHDRRAVEAPPHGRPAVGRRLHIRSSMGRMLRFEVLAARRCLVCEFTQEAWEAADTDEIGPLCARCHAPTERTAVVERRRLATSANPHAEALGRLGGLKGGPARAARLSPSRRRAIARQAARARWHAGGGREDG